MLWSDIRIYNFFMDFSEQAGSYSEKSLWQMLAYKMVIHYPLTRRLEWLMEGHNLFFKPICRDSPEIYHCLLLISFGKCRFKPLSIWDLSSNSERSDLRFETWKTSFWQKSYGSLHDWSLEREICKPVLKLDFTVHGIMEPLSEFVLSCSWQPSLVFVVAPQWKYAGCSHVKS